MTPDPITVEEETPLEDLVRLMEQNDIKRLPVMSGGTLKGIVTRSNLLQAVASMAHEISDPTADDDHIRDRITRTVNQTDWRPIGFDATVRNGVGICMASLPPIRPGKQRSWRPETTAGVKEVQDHLCFVDTWSGFYGDRRKT